jgi:hypothetical protein
MVNLFEDISVDIVAEDPRYPILTVQGKFGTVGYALNKDTGELERVCICGARGYGDCCCGVYDHIDYYYDC